MRMQQFHPIRVRCDAPWQRVEMQYAANQGDYAPASSPDSTLSHSRPLQIRTIQMEPVHMDAMKIEQVLAQRKIEYELNGYAGI